MIEAIGTFEVFLLVAAVAALVAQRLRLPYTIGLLVAGLGMATSSVGSHIEVSKELIYLGLLPPLVFEAALNLRWPEVRRDAVVLSTFASLGVVLSALITAIGMHFLAKWEWPSAMVFGALISATDPVSVIATFKESGVGGRLRLLMEGESLMNDGTAAVAFVVALSFALGQPLSAGNVLMQVVYIAGGGILAGCIVGGAVLLIAGRTEDPMIEISFTTVAAYGSFFAAEHFGASGVLAALTAGLMVGNIGPLGPLSSRGREAVLSFWEYAAFVSNSLIFTLIGLQITRQTFTLDWGSASVCAIVVVMAGRAVAIYPCSWLFKASEKWRVSSEHQHVLFWGGLRGALALALVLGLPADMPRREELAAVTFAVVAFSIVIQGLTMPPLLRKLGQVPIGGSKHGSH